MLVAAAVCPHPPLLVPELAGGAAPELDDLRLACDQAVRAVLDRRPDVVVVVGADPRADETWHDLEDGPAGLREYAPWPSPADIAARSGRVPLAHTIGGWLLDRADHTAARQLVGVAPTAGSPACIALGRELAGGPTRVGLLIMGDGSARRTTASPGRYDERAVPFDDGVVEALRVGDTAALAALDAPLAEDLMVAGRAAWQVLAGAASGLIGAGPIRAQLLWSGAPYGVGYVVAVWSRPA